VTPVELARLAMYGTPEERALAVEAQRLLATRAEDRAELQRVLALAQEAAGEPGLAARQQFAASVSALLERWDAEDGK
jgi:hypothetical protein